MRREQLRESSWRVSLRWAAFGLMLTGLCGVGCQDTQIILPSSLGGPTALAVAQGDVCLRLQTDTETGLLDAQIDACRAPAAGTEAADEGGRERGGIGLVANLHDARVAVLALDRAAPSLVDLDLATPGVTHIAVGERPIDLATSPTGEVAYVLNEVDRDVSLINLWSLRAMSQRIDLPGIPVSGDVHLRTGALVVGVASPTSQLVYHPGVTCERPSNLPLEVGEHDPDQGCVGVEDATTTLDLPGVIKDVKLEPSRAIAHVLYSDRAWLSVIALSSEELSPGADQCLDGSTEAPCEVARISLTYGCSDGLDNDGDGLIDQLDPQCFGPLGAEAAEGGGAGVRAMGACADGLDNDGDGLVDRDDPNCRVASQQAEGGEDVPGYTELVTECSDGQDNDGDGLLDANDPDCYGAQGRREASVDMPGFGALSVDELGILGYVTHPSRQEVLVIDLQHRRLLPAGTSAGVTNPFTENLGVAIGRRVSPVSLQGSVHRRVARDPRDLYVRSHGIVDYDLGVYVAGDNGFLYYVQALGVSCEVWESGGFLSDATFYLEPWRLQEKQESRCLVVPETFLTDRVDVAPSCEEMVLCRSCLRERGDGVASEENLAACKACALYEDFARFEEVEEVCSLEERQEGGELFSRVVNPRFVVREALTGVVEFDAAEKGRAQCVLPDALLDALGQYLIDNPTAPQTLGCGSPALPQPLSATEALDSPDYGSAQRFDLLERRELRKNFLESGAINTQLVVDTEDFAIREEDWTITYEGVLPGTRRIDGLIEEEGVLDIGSLDPCLSDILPGDRVVLLTEPGTETGGVPSECEVFQTPETEEEQGAWLEYEVSQVYTDRLVLSTLDEESGAVQQLPTTGCFPRGIRYEVRASGEWTVVGSVSGIASGRVARGGVCVPGNGASAPRVSSRVRAGERFIGPQMSFYMTPGQIEPVRDTSYTVSVGRNFNAASTPSGSIFSMALPAAAFVGRERLFSGTPSADSGWVNTRREWLIAGDASDNLIILQTPSSQNDLIEVR